MDGLYGDGYSPLDEIEALLGEMYELAERAARDGCPDAERLALQERLCALRELLDECADLLGPDGAHSGDPRDPRS